MATLDDIARELGISKSTVSKAINGAKDVSKAMRQSVLEKAVELGYSRISRNTSPLRVAIFITNMEYEHPDDFGYEIIAGFRKVAEPSGFDVEIVPLTIKKQTKIHYDEYMILHNFCGGLFLGLSLDDPRQPGLHIRTPMNGRRLDDEEMIAYYTELIRSLGGCVNAYYLDAYAVSVHGQVYSFMDDALCRTRAFVMTDVPSPRRHPGWPLDSISKHRNTDRYFVDGKTDQIHEDPVAVAEYKAKTTAFLVKTFGLED